MSNTERQRRHRERVRNDPTRVTSKLWFEEAERVAAGLWVMTWIARQRGIDTMALTELMKSSRTLRMFCTIRCGQTYP